MFPGIVRTKAALIVTLASPGIVRTKAGLTVTPTALRVPE